MQLTELHPSVEDLTAFSVGQLPAEKAATVESHIGECTPCCETLMGLSTEDTFVGLLKETRDPVDGVTIGVSECSAHDGDVQSRMVLVDHPRYQIEELIAKGGMGEVFKAKHRMMDRTVALKVISQQLTRNPEAVERFHREVKTAAHLSHKNIVTAYDAEQAQGVHFLVMEYVDGVDLAELVKQGNQLSISTACDYAQQAANGLQYAHQKGMVHRDIKPHNLMLTNDDTVKILDFGLASLSASNQISTDPDLPENASLTAAGSIMGTPDFIAPEQAANARAADIRSDIYSLGATLYYLLTGQPPFAEGSVAERLKHHAETEPVAVQSLREVPQELADVVSRMMAKDPQQRFQTPQEVADALAPFVDQFRTTTKVGPATAAGSGRSWWPRSKFTGSAFAAFILIVAGIIYLETNKGTLVIESVANEVEVVISKATETGGEDYVKLKVVDTATGTQVERLPSGDYKVTLGETGSEYELSNGGFTLRRGEDVVIKVTRKESEDSKAPKMAESEPQPLKPMPISDTEQTMLMVKSSQLSPEMAQDLEDVVSNEPDNIVSRLKLIGYYGYKSLQRPEARKRHVELLSWLFTNYPESAASGQARLFGSSDPEGYVALKSIWLQNIRNHPENVLILRRAANFVQMSDKVLTTEFLKKAQEIEPDNADVAAQLGQIYRLGLMRLSGEERKQQASKALEQFERALAQSEGSPSESNLRLDVAKAALAAGELDKAKSQANELLEKFTGDAKDWNSGNVTHDANSVLGHLSLQAGQVEEAGRYLIAAGRTTGSPQLNSFGPSMSLAKTLIEQGERDVVLRYFGLCEEFWKKDKLQEWAAIVKGGGMPDFGGNQYR